MEHFISISIIASSVLLIVTIVSVRRENQRRKRELEKAEIISRQVHFFLKPITDYFIDTSPEEKKLPYYEFDMHGSSLGFFRREKTSNGTLGYSEKEIEVDLESKTFQVRTCGLHFTSPKARVLSPRRPLTELENCIEEILGGNILERTPVYPGQGYPE